MLSTCKALKKMPNPYYVLKNFNYDYSIGKFSLKAFEL